MSNQIMPLKPYLESITEICGGLEKDRLLDLVLSLARDVIPYDRSRYLETLKDKLQNPASASIDKYEESNLLEAIKEVLNSIDERIDSIESGSYWDDEENWTAGSHYDYDDGPDPLSDDDATQLASLFHQTGGLFLNKQFALAAKAYARLLEVFDRGYTVSLADVDLNEAKARYLRSLAETTSGVKRVQTLFKAMLADTEQSNWRDAMTSPNLRDVIDSFPGEFKGWDRFLIDWKNGLSKRKGDRATALLLEAIGMTEGTSGLEKYANEFGNKKPLAFVVWVDAEKSAKDWARMKQASLLGLNAARKERNPKKEPDDDFSYEPPAPSLILHFAACLEEAGRELNEDETILQARWETFSDRPTNDSLRPFLLKAESMQVWDSSLNEACGYLQGVPGKAALTMKAELLRGNWEAVFALKSEVEPASFEFSEPGRCESLYIAALLTGLCRDHAPSAQVVKTLLSRYADKHDHDFWDPDDDAFLDEDVPKTPDEPDATFFSSRILNAIQRNPLPPDRWGELYREVEGLVETQISGILDNRSRSSYEVAGHLLAALAETLSCNGDHAGANALIHQYVKVKYNRLSAFRRELEPYLKRAKL